MGRIYYAPLEITSAPLVVTTDAEQDIWYLKAGTGDKLRLHGFEITSAAVAAADCELQLCRRTTDGSGGTALVEVNGDEADNAKTAEAVALRTTVGTEGDVIKTYNWEQLGPLGHVFTPEMRPVVQEGGRICLSLMSALGSSTNWSGWVCWEEL